MKKMIAVAALSTALAGSSAAREDFADFNAALAEFKGRAGVSVSAPHAEAAVKEWTVLVYANGKNNLSYWILDNINDMERVGGTDGVNIVAEVGYVESYGYSGPQVKRYFIIKDGDKDKINSPLLHNFGRRDMGYWKNLEEFILWGKRTYPARKYMLIVSGHGVGWRGVARDDESGSAVSIPELAGVLARAGGVDVFVSDACRMQMASVVYELKDSVKYVAGSEENVMGRGSDYRLLLSRLTDNPAVGPKEAALAAVDAYAGPQSYAAAAGLPALASAIHAPAMGGLASRLRLWVDAVMAANEGRALYRAKDEALSFRDRGVNSFYSDSRDLYHFIELVEQESKSAEVRGAGAELRRYISADLVAGNQVVSQKYEKAHGVAIYISNRQHDPAYEQLRWARDTRWPQFLDWLVDNAR